MPSAVSRLCPAVFFVCCASLDAGWTYTGAVSLDFAGRRVECVSLEAAGVGLDGCGSLVVTDGGWKSLEPAGGGCVSRESLGSLGVARG